MFALDFTYDDIKLSDFGLMIGSMDNFGIETVSSGGDINFNQISTRAGKNFTMYNNSYDECLTATFQIFRNPCAYSDYEEMYLSPEESSQISRWLCRHEYHKFNLDQNGYENIHWNAVFQTKEIHSPNGNNQIIGLELTVLTDAPFSYNNYYDETFEVSENGYIELNDKSDEIGFIYPEMTVKLKASGDLRIYSNRDDKLVSVMNCANGEILTFKGNDDILISSTGHDLSKDFSYYFPKIINTYDNIYNKFTFSLPCTVNIKYEPIIKTGF